MRKLFLSTCQKKQLLGLDIGSQCVKMIQIESGKRGWRLKYGGMRFLFQRMREEDRPESAMTLEEAIRDLFHEGHIQQPQVACSMRGPSVMVKSIRVPRMTYSELQAHLEWEMDQYIPADAGEVYWDFHILHSSDPTPPVMTIPVLLVAAKKEAVNRQRELLQGVGLNPMVMDVDYLALANMYTFNYHDEGDTSVLLVNVSPSGVSLIVVDDENPIYVREVEVGLEGDWGFIAHAFKNPLNNVPGDKVGDRLEFRNGLVNAILQEVSREVQKTIEYCRDIHPQCRIEKVYLCGGYAGLPGLATMLQAQGQASLELINPFRELEVSPELESQRFFSSFRSLAGVAVGLALRGLGH